MQIGKPRFTVRRRTFKLSQFEFEVDYSFNNCLNRLTHLYLMREEKELADARGVYYRPIEPSSVTIHQQDDCAEFELRYHDVLVSGTFYPLTTGATLFVGISRLEIEAEEPYFYLGMAAIFFTAAIALFAVASVLGLGFVLIYATLAYIPARFRIENAVQSLVDAVIPIWPWR